MPRSAVKKRKKSSGWKKYQSSTQTNRRLVLGLLALALLIAIILTGKFLGFVGSLGRPLAPDGVNAKVYQWDGGTRVTLAVKADRLYLLSLDPGKRSLQLIKIPDETYLNLPFGFGSWPARSVYGLGQAEKAPMGAKLVMETLRTNFNLPVDGYLILSGDLADRPLEASLESVRKNPLQSFVLISRSKTDLTFWEYLRFLFAIRNVRADKMQVLDLGQSSLTSWILLADGSRVLGFDPLKLGLFFQNRLSDTKLSEEGLSVGVFNTTDRPGLAEKVARLVSNMGGRVVITGNYPEKFSGSFIVGKDSYTKSRFTEVFTPDCLGKGFNLADMLSRKSGSCIPEKFNTDSLRADVNIMIGEDYFVRYNTR